jgi:hypothetical protein
MLTWNNNKDRSSGAECAEREVLCLDFKRDFAFRAKKSALLLHSGVVLPPPAKIAGNCGGNAARSSGSARCLIQSRMIDFDRELRRADDVETGLAGVARGVAHESRVIQERREGRINRPAPPCLRPPESYFANTGLECGFSG